MALDLCGGEASRVSMAGKPPDERRSIALPAGEVERLTGVAIEAHESASILRALGFAVSGTDPMDAVVPTWRPDVEGKADLVEEVIRIAGLDRVVPTPLPRLHAGVTAPVLTLLQKRTRLARRALTALGLDEAVTWSFIATPVATLFGGGAPALTLSNPIAADLATMRPSLVPGLVAAAQRNARRGARDAALCEVGQIFLGDGEGDQRNAAASLRAGAAKTTGRHWSQRDGVVDAFDAKADAFALLAALGVSLAAIQVAPGGPGFLHPGRSATLRFGPNVIGWFGELHPRALEALDAQGPIAAFEIILDAVPAPKARPTRAKPKLERSDFMPVERDLAFVVARDVHAGEIVRAAQGADRALIAGVRVFDVYEGPGVPEGSKSIGVALTLQPREKTLTDAEIEACVARVVAAVAKRTGAIVRT
jgi:phenylalanyl-tRNA synthetase beta chain